MLREREKERETEGERDRGRDRGRERQREREKEIEIETEGERDVLIQGLLSIFFWATYCIGTGSKLQGVFSESYCMHGQH